MVDPTLELGKQLGPVQPYAGKSAAPRAPLAIVPYALASNLAVIAGSGSGKSSFLARLVEELLIKTACRCIILDSNSDFSLFKTLRDEAAGDFSRWWSRQRISLRTAHTGITQRSRSKIGISWHLVSMDFLADDLRPELAGQLYELHTAFRALAEVRSLGGLKREGEVQAVKLKAVLEELLGRIEPRRARNLTTSQLEAKIRDELMQLKPDPQGLATIVESLTGGKDESLEGYLNERIDHYIQCVAAAARINADVVAFYTGKLRSLMADGLIDDGIATRLLTPQREASYVEVLDLASLRDRPTQRLVAGARVAAEWTRAMALREHALGRVLLGGKVDEADELRTPTFVIVDEAHTLLPNVEADSRSAKELRELFRRIVAEGRKYSLHLIIATQRPQKLDGAILSECENILFMRCNPSDVESCDAIKGRLDGISLDECITYERGEGLMVGQWAGGAGGQRVQFELPRTKPGSPDLPRNVWCKDPNDDPGACAPEANDSGDLPVPNARTGEET